MHCFGVPESELRGPEDRIALHQPFKSSSNDDVNELIKGVAEGDRSAVTKEFWISVPYSYSRRLCKLEYPLPQGRQAYDDDCFYYFQQ